MNKGLEEILSKLDDAAQMSDDALLGFIRESKFVFIPLGFVFPDHLYVQRLNTLADSGILIKELWQPPGEFMPGYRYFIKND